MRCIKQDGDGNQYVHGMATAAFEVTMSARYDSARKEWTQELSYRKQITRQLRTQYVEGICKPNYSVTLKTKLRVIQGHWKRTIE